MNNLERTLTYIPEGDQEAKEWLLGLAEAAYEVLDSWEFGDLASAVTELGGFLPVRTEP